MARACAAQRRQDRVTSGRAYVCSGTRLTPAHAARTARKPHAAREVAAGVSAHLFAVPPVTSCLIKKTAKSVARVLEPEWSCMEVAVPLHHRFWRYGFERRKSATRSKGVGSFLPPLSGLPAGDFAACRGHAAAAGPRPRCGSRASTVRRSPEPQPEVGDSGVHSRHESSGRYGHGIQCRTVAAHT